MQLCIQTHGIELTEKTKRQAYEKLEVALDRLEDVVVSVSVYLIDTNGPLLGGVDKACRIIVHIRTQVPLVLEAIDENVDVVLDRITDRLGVAACQRADSLPGKRRHFRGWVDPEEFSGFKW